VPGASVPAQEGAVVTDEATVAMLCGALYRERRRRRRQARADVLADRIAPRVFRQLPCARWATQLFDACELRLGFKALTKIGRDWRTP
jgi:hypothetical protein